MFYDNQVLLEVISQRAPPFLATSKKAFLPPLVWPKIEYTRSLN